jgi:hypothetical protein
VTGTEGQAKTKTDNHDQKLIKKYLGLFGDLPPMTEDERQWMEDILRVDES